MTLIEEQPMLDETKKRKMRHSIIELERKNVNTKSRTEKEMVRNISDIIEEEVTSRY